MKGRIKSTAVGWLIHFSVIIIAMNLLHIYEYLADPLYKGRGPWEFFVYHTFYDTDTLVLLICFLYIEINYQLLFKKDHFFLFIASSAVVGILGYIAFRTLQENSYKDIDSGLRQILIIAAYALVYAMARKYLHQIFYKKDLQLQRSNSELDALKAQINPHFLFNSLNYLYGTALNEKAPSTAGGIDQLADLMRYTIKGSHENFVPVKDEFEFINNYLALQQARLPQKDTIKIDIQIPSALPDVQVAPLLILPLIENAFKYGITMDEPCFVYINIGINRHELLVEINNSIAESAPELKGNHTGIKNTAQRLKLLYPNRHKLKQTNDGKTCQTTLQIELNP
jgi:sensor histidine kinase YesM